MPPSRPRRFRTIAARTTGRISSSILRQLKTMVSRQVRSKAAGAAWHGNLRSGHGRLQDMPPVNLPHHIKMEVLTFLDARTIVRSRGVSRAFRDDAPALIETLEFDRGQKFPSFEGMRVYSKVKEVRLEGHNQLVRDAAAGLRGSLSLRRLAISRPPSLKQKTPVSKTTTKKLCALPLADFDVRRVELVFPPRMDMPAWRTLQTLVIREGFLRDTSIINLAASILAGPLPLRHLDLSRNLFGHENAMQPLAQALRSFPMMETLDLGADRISSDGAKLVLRELLDNACPMLRTLDLSLNFLHNGVLNYLANGIGRAGHGLQNLRKLGIGGRFSPDESVTSFEYIARGLAAGGLPLLDFLHLQGDVGTQEVGPLVRKIKLGGCPNLAVIKMERSAPFPYDEYPDSIEDAVSSMLELVTSSCAPPLREVHVLGMNLGEGLEQAEEERTSFYRAGNESSFHRLALAGAVRGVMIYV